MDMELENCPNLLFKWLEEDHREERVDVVENSMSILHVAVNLQD